MSSRREFITLLGDAGDRVAARGAGAAADDASDRISPPRTVGAIAAEECVSPRL
jgi:hypothetical protein